MYNSVTIQMIQGGTIKNGKVIKKKAGDIIDNCFRLEVEED